MNAVIMAVLAMLILSLLRVNVVFSLIIAALIGGITGGIGITKTIEVFTSGVGDSASVALSYAMLGAFALAISKTGLPEVVVQFVLKIVGRESDSKRKALSKVLIILIILIMSCFSQNVIPIHIAFIPILIPPLLKVFNELQLDRRLIASVITFGLITPYMFLPAGYGIIYHEILSTNMKEAGMTINPADIPTAMAIPALGMVVGLLTAILIAYRKPRIYKNVELSEIEENQEYSKKGIAFALVSVIVSLIVQLQFDSMIFGAVAGIIVLYLSGSVKWSEADNLLTNGMRMMAFMGFVMLSAAGFASVLEETGDITALVENSADLIGKNQSLGALAMLIVGLLVTIGIGSSFSTIPIITAIFVPLCIQLGFSPLATVAIIGTAGALGDAGSPVSDSTLGPTSGLNMDGQHDHIWDTCVPTFILYNIPLIIFGWIAALVL